MIHRPNASPTNNEQLTWNSRIKVTGLTGGKLDQRSRRLPGTEKKEQPGTSRIEQEILWAVVVLYAAIIACFAGLHIIGLVLVG